MAIGSSKNRELVLALKSVINVLEDGQKGMAHIGEHLKNTTLRRYFLAESLTVRTSAANSKTNFIAAACVMSMRPERCRAPCIAPGLKSKPGSEVAMRA